MKIDRSNYEIWFIDWLDGNLNNDQVEQLNQFLSENPDQKEELKEMDSSPIIPLPYEFMGKSGLFRAPSDITESQFEFLCAAYAENDLSSQELQEFSQIIDIDPQKRNLSELFRRLKLIAPDIRYVNKKKLFKRTPLQKTIRLSAALLSAAATAAILITLSIFIQEDEKVNISQIITKESGAQQLNIPKQTDHSFIELRKSEEIISIKEPVAAVNKITAGIKDELPEKNEITDSLQESLSAELIFPVEIPSCSDIFSVSGPGLQKLALISLSVDNQPQPEERWAPGRFVAKLFRDKILKEGTTDDSPIKGYEIAEAGVTGINKLFGWEMAFEKNNDENGELKSIYFSSKILKIQAPVNKSENNY